MIDIKQQMKDANIRLDIIKSVSKRFIIRNYIYFIHDSSDFVRSVSEWKLQLLKNIIYKATR